MNETCTPAVCFLLGILIWSYHEPLIRWTALKVLTILKLAAPIFYFAQLLPDLPWIIFDDLPYLPIASSSSKTSGAAS